MTPESLRIEISKLVEQFSYATLAEKVFKPGESYIPASGKMLGAQELKYMVEATLDGWLTTGRFNANFEVKLAELIGVKHALTVNSGSSANLVAFSTLTSPRLKDRAVKQGDEVISVAAGFPTTVNPIVQFGAIPVFVDIDAETLNIDASLIENAITKKTKAIVLAHTLGNSFDLSKVKKLCKKYDLWLIEDCCDALGTTYDGKMLGSWGDLATLSFYPAHHITMGEGGAVLTNNPALKVIAESFRDWGRDCYCAPGCDDTCGRRFGRKYSRLPDGYDHKYVYSHLGYNLKITDMQAACGLAQLERVNEFIEKRKKNFSLLEEQFRTLDRYFNVAKATDNSEPSWFGFPVTIKNDCNISRLELLKYLEDNLIGTRLVFAGNLTCQPYFRKITYRIEGELKNTDRIMSQSFWLGVHPSLNNEHINYIGDKLRCYLKNK